MAQQSRTVVAVLHDLNAAAAYSSRMVLMSSTRVVAVGSPREVLEARLLSEIYGQAMMVIEHPVRDCPLVLPADS